ncbi:L-serine ammonia-lyase, iron-sulfur-dependent subunit beta [Proteinivorax hydrogeniformans]|uniref:L-serine deaminase n=1 Tax=Proteinivorax hydrogeniformans TaxID=1826727 RepID=A0AAU8HPF4_9FIRM
MSVFDIIGPIMIGPSSSHTAGAARLGRMAKIIAGEPIKSVVIKLYGSFAKTYKGHGTDIALVAGLLGLSEESSDLKNSFEIAKEKGVNFEIIEESKGASHPNTAVFDIMTESKRINVEGCSIGGGNIIITKIDDFSLNLTGKFNTLIIPHKDMYGTITKVTHKLAVDKVNIANMSVARKEKGVSALMVVETDQEVSNMCLEKIEAIDEVDIVSFIPPL